MCNKIILNYKKILKNDEKIIITNNLKYDNSQFRIVLANNKLPLKNGDKKFIEYIEINPEQKDSVLVIGGNPKSGEKYGLDETNMRIIRYLKKHENIYKDYYLVNLYSFITENYKTLKLNETNSSFEDKIDTLIKSNIFSKIIIIWGPSLGKYKPKINCKLYQTLITRKTYITTYNKVFCHGSRLKEINKFNCKYKNKVFK